MCSGPAPARLCSSGQKSFCRDRDVGAVWEDGVGGGEPGSSAQDRMQIRTLGALLVWEWPPSSHQFLGCGSSGGPRTCPQVWPWWTDPGRATLKVGLGCSGCWGPTRQPRCPAGREPRCTDRKRVRQGPGEERGGGEGPPAPGSGGRPCSGLLFGIPDN